MLVSSDISPLSDSSVRFEGGENEVVGLEMIDLAEKLKLD